MKKRQIGSSFAGILLIILLLSAILMSPLQINKAQAKDIQGLVERQAMEP